MRSWTVDLSRGTGARRRSGNSVGRLLRDRRVAKVFEIARPRDSKVSRRFLKSCILDNSCSSKNSADVVKVLSSGVFVPLALESGTRHEDVDVTKVLLCRSLDGEANDGEDLGESVFHASLDFMVDFTWHPRRLQRRIVVCEGFATHDDG